MTLTKSCSCKHHCIRRHPHTLWTLFLHPVVIIVVVIITLHSLSLLHKWSVHVFFPMSNYIASSLHLTTTAVIVAHHRLHELWIIPSTHPHSLAHTTHSATCALCNACTLEVQLTVIVNATVQLCVDWPPICKQCNFPNLRFIRLFGRNKKAERRIGSWLIWWLLFYSIFT